MDTSSSNVNKHCGLIAGKMWLSITGFVNEKVHCMERSTQNLRKHQVGLWQPAPPPPSYALSPAKTHLVDKLRQWPTAVPQSPTIQQGCMTQTELIREASRQCRTVNSTVQRTGRNPLKAGRTCPISEACLASTQTFPHLNLADERTQVKPQGWKEGRGRGCSH